MFSTMPNLKQIGKQVSWHMTMLNVYFRKSRQLSSLPWLFVQNKFSLSFNKQTSCGNRLNLIQINI